MKILFVIAMVALAGIGFLYFQGHEQDREHAREVAKARVSTNNIHEQMRNQAIDYAERGYKQGLEFAESARKRDLEAGKDSVQVEQLFQTKLINLRAERDEKIAKAQKQYPGVK